jgi:N6-adenosine-specific RNA methylase IME4
MKRSLPAKRKPLTVIRPDKDAAEIGDLYRKAHGSLVESIRFAIACGKRLVLKKASLKHGEWLPWLRANADALGFDTPLTAQRLMKLAANTSLATHLDEAGAVAISRQLWGHDDDDPAQRDRENIDLDDLLRDEDGQLTPRAREFIREVKAEKTALKKAIREAREVTLGNKQLALPEKRYGIILADPEWDFVVGSDAWMSTSSPSNHYATSPTEEIAARPVADIAADDCVLFLWSTVPHLSQALYVMEAWGFTYKTGLVWVKSRLSNGYWLRGRHEHLLIGTRGHPPCPAPGTQRDSVIIEAWDSVIEAPTGQHSLKPVAAYEFIERFFPTMPKIELNARQARPGWDRWGLEAPEQDEGTP